MEDVDLIVVGAGQGGVPLAANAAGAGKRVVLFERKHLGGTCVNVGCTPSKAFLASAHNAGRARDAAGVHVHCDVRVDVPAVMQRVRSIRNEWHDGVGKKLADAGVRVVMKEARFVDKRTLTAGDVTVRAPLVVLDTGTNPACPPIDGLAELPYLTNETFFDLENLPPRIVVIGGGYVGLELGQGCRRLGAQVTILETGKRLLPREDEDATEVLAQALRDDGVDLRVGMGATCARRGTRFGVKLEDGQEIETDAILVAAGREPNTKALDCGKSGIDLDERGFVTTDAHLRTTCEGVFALGEVAGQPAFTHVAWEDHRRVEAVLKGEMRTKDDRVLAYSTFTEPQLGRVGMNEAEARSKGRDVRVATLQLADDARGTEWNLTRGFYRIVVDAKDEKILGATLIGYEAGEIVHVILAHIMAGSTWRVLERSVHIHPTFCEALPTLVRQFAGGSG
ncbi:MAG: FAD-dependent oxidoreductase [Candidatus Eremiobacteraeota bacterium]|nr:FAD-dependent oxidoreductase [Candidatus Eremiobacteraeota bacterium]